MQRALACLIVATAASGCVTELLGETDQTVRNIACRVVAQETPLMLVVHHADGSALDVDAAVLAWLATMQEFGRTTNNTVVEHHIANVDDLGQWAMAQIVIDGQATRLHLLIMGSLPDNATMMHPLPGVVVLSSHAIQAGAARGLDEALVTRAVLLHAMGHALGVVNQGIPLNHTVTAGREGPQNHEPSARSVLHSGWHGVSTMPRTNATYDAYSDAVRDDWRAAATGVCA